MWPWMNQGFSPMYGMGGGFGSGWGGYQQYQPQAPSGADQGNARIDKLRNRVSNLQEQWKGAGTEQQAGIQGRIDQMQGRIKGLRQDRRQGEGLYAQPQGQAEAGQMQQQGGGQDYWTAARMRNAQPMPMGGGMNFGGMPWGMPNMGGMRNWMQPQMGNYNPQAGQNEMAKAPNPGAQPVAPRQGGTPQSYYEGSQFNTQFGNLVPASVGNGNIYKQNGSDGQTLYHYDPTAGWKSMTNQEYQGYNNPADFYQDPNQYAAQAGGNRNDYQMRNGMWQTQLGTGTYR